MLFSVGSAAVAGDAAPTGFSLSDQPGAYLDVLLDGKIAGRYMYAHDTSTKERRVETYKPYLHVFDAEGKAPITKGPGGLYPHHRGIFIGWNKIGFNGNTYDRWHMIGGDIVHEKFLKQESDAEQATITSLTHWEDEKHRAIIDEERTMVFHRGPAPARLRIDFTSKLSAPNGDVKLNGDPEHSGVHFRPANEVDVKETVYTLAAENANAHKDHDYPWAGVSFTLNHHRYSVVELNHPDNPKGTKWSAYRDYGRIGAFATASIPEGKSIVFKYRFLIADGEMLPTAVIEASMDQFAGAARPTEAPKITVHPAEVTAPAAPKKPGNSVIQKVKPAATPSPSPAAAP